MREPLLRDKKLYHIIIQDFRTLKVILAGFVTKEELQKIFDERKVYLQNYCFENLYEIQEWAWDKNETYLLLKVKTHKNAQGYNIYTSFSELNEHPYSYLQKLEKKIEQSINGKREHTHITNILKKGKSKIAQKFGEESIELVIEAGKQDDQLFKDEAADTLYYFLILLRERGFSLQDILKQLKLQKRKI